MPIADLNPYRYEFESQIRKGLEMIQSAVDEQKKTVSMDIAQWKEMEDTKSSQIQSLTLEVQRLRATVSQLENLLEKMENENKSLKNNQSSLQSKYSDLKRSGLQLEKFRKSIAQMVELSPQVTFEEPSLMFDHPSLKSLKLSASPTPSSSVEGVSPSPKNVSKHDRSKKIEMTPTSTLKRNVSPLRSSSTFEKSSFSAHEDIDSHDHSYTSSTEKSATLRTSLRNSTTAKDAQLLYRKIKDVLSIEDFTQFASVIHAFNSHKLNVDETLSKIKELIPDRDLFCEMKELIYKALEENSSQKNQL